MNTLHKFHFCEVNGDSDQAGTSGQKYLLRLDKYLCLKMCNNFNTIKNTNIALTFQ